MELPILSVCLITYNHVNYIKKAVESVLMQKTSFKFELIIADDYSIDGTRDILYHYKKEYPDIITLLLQKENVGAARNWIDLLSATKAKYIAYFEGDDFWTDPNKLQIQYDFLESHPDYSMCFHNADIVSVENNVVVRKFNNYRKTTYSGHDILRQWLIPTASSFFRNVLPKPIPSIFIDCSHGDLTLFLFVALFGKIGYIDRNMSVYRRNEKSISSGFSGIAHNIKQTEDCKAMIEFFSPHYKRLLSLRCADYFCSTAFLYAKEKNKRMSFTMLKQAMNTDATVLLRNPKYFLATLFLLIKL